MINPSESVPANIFNTPGNNSYSEDNIRWQSTLAFQQNQLTYMRDDLSDQRVKGFISENNSSDLYQQLNLQLAVVISLQVKLREQEDINIHSPKTPQQDILNMDVRINQERLRDEILYFEQQYLQLKQQYRQLVNKI